MPWCSFILSEKFSNGRSLWITLYIFSTTKNKSLVVFLTTIYFLLIYITIYFTASVDFAWERFNSNSNINTISQSQNKCNKFTNFFRLPNFHTGTTFSQGGSILVSCISSFFQLNSFLCREINQFKFKKRKPCKENVRLIKIVPLLFHKTLD